MVGSRVITQQRLDHAAAAAVRATLHNVLRRTGARCDAELRCSYCVAAEGVAEVTCCTNLMFRWELSWKGVSIHAEVLIRSDKAVYSGLLAPPHSWTYVLMALSLPRAINETGGLSWMREGGALTECTGLAWASPLHEPLESCVLFCGGARVEHIVLARTQTGLLCHTGNCRTRLPFDPSDIVQADLAQVWDEEAPPRKRLRGRIQRLGHQELVTKQPQAYATAVAFAQLMAAENRDDMDDLVQARFQMNPLDWDLAPGAHVLLLWRVQVGAKWQAKMKVVKWDSVMKELKQ